MSESIGIVSRENERSFTTSTHQQRLQYLSVRTKEHRRCSRLRQSAAAFARADNDYLPPAESKSVINCSRDTACAQHSRLLHRLPASARIRSKNIADSNKAKIDEKTAAAIIPLLTRCGLKFSDARMQRPPALQRFRNSLSVRWLSWFLAHMQSV